MKTLLVVSIAMLISAVLAGPANAAAPTNDARENARAVAVPQSVSGTTVEATLEPGEGSECTGGTKNSVWYRLEGTGKRVAIGLSAAGDLDAVIDVYSFARSQPTSVDCEKTNKAGFGIVDFKTTKGTAYYVRVAEQANSVSGSFSLNFLAASDPAKKPGKRLPKDGAKDTVNLASNPSDAWSVTLHAGTTYRLNLAASNDSGCVTAMMYGPGQSIEDGDGQHYVSCSDGFTQFAPGPGEGGRYTIIVSSSRRTLQTQHYKLQLGRASRDDVAPGIFWRGGAKHGRLNGNGIDVRDLYNFDLDRRAFVTLRLKTNADFTVQLFSVGGRRIASSDGDSLTRKLSPGTYFASVVAEDGSSGAYALRRSVKTITHTTIAFNGARHALISPGSSASLSASVDPGSKGRLEIVVQRKDPLYGWMYVRTYRGTGRSGKSVSFHPSGVGEYRARAEFKGSRGANPSRSRYARLSVRR